MLHLALDDDATGTVAADNAAKNGAKYDATVPVSAWSTLQRAILIDAQLLSPPPPSPPPSPPSPPPLPPPSPPPWPTVAGGSNDVRFSLEFQGVTIDSLNSLYASLYAPSSSDSYPSNNDGYPSISNSYPYRRLLQRSGTASAITGVEVFLNSVRSVISKLTGLPLSMVGHPATRKITNTLLQPNSSPIS